MWLTSENKQALAIESRMFSRQMNRLTLLIVTTMYNAKTLYTGNLAKTYLKICTCIKKSACFIHKS